MSTERTKKPLIMYILRILHDYTDKDHRLGQKEIVNLLNSEYGVKVSPKTVRRNIMDLQDMGYTIEYEETMRYYTCANGRKVDNDIWKDFYLEKDFDDSELRLLIDSLLFARNIPDGQRRHLIRKLEGLSSHYFKSHVKHVAAMPEMKQQNPELFLTIEILNEAISNNQQISCNYSVYATDKKQHLKLDKDGSVKQYLINPYQMAVTNGRYYLICNKDETDDVAHFRLDRISNIQLLDSSAKPMKEVKGLSNGLDLPKHMAEHVYMFSGKSVAATFRMKKVILNDVFDWFGTDITFYDETEDEVTARVYVNWSAMRYWALQYCKHIRILTPTDLAQTIQEDLRGAYEKYVQTKQ